MLQDQEALAAEVTDHQTKHTYLYIFLLCYPWFLCLIGFLCSNQMERTFIAIKPDGVQRGLVCYLLFSCNFMSSLFKCSKLLNL